MLSSSCIFVSVDSSSLLSTIMLNLQRLSLGVAGFVVVIAAVMYPIAVDPYLRPQKWGMYIIMLIITVEYQLFVNNTVLCQLIC